MPEEYKYHLNQLGLKYTEQKDFGANVKDADIVYMTRVQKERFSDPIEYERTKNAYILKNRMLEGSKETMKVLHPLPRVNEIDQDVDSNPKAYYFIQALNGVYVRQAIIASILGYK
jgi:aspartate carbamoyltransferase catalytic subunit